MLSSAFNHLQSGLGQQLHNTRTLDDSTDYPRFESAMSWFGYDWESKQVTTDDDYILTTFHILGKTGQPRPDSHKASVLLMHGAYIDGPVFFNYVDGGYGKSFLLSLVDEGYDIWVGNNRGTEYSQGHQTLSAADDSEYWEFSWAEMGLYDDVANIKMIKEEADVDKVIYMGYS